MAKNIQKVKQPKLVSKALAQKLVKIAARQYETSERYKQPRMEEIQGSVDLNDNKVLPAGRGRFNVPLPVMSGFVNTLLSKIDEGVKLDFKYTNVANLMKKKKMQATWDKESGPSVGKWDRVDRAVKKNAIFSGVGIYELYTESDPEYKNYFRGVHYLDFHCEPMGGQDIEKHIFTGVAGVFRSKSELEDGVESEYYYDWGVENLIDRTGKDDQKRNYEIYKNKINIYSNAGLDPDSHAYVGESVYNLCKWVLTHNGKRYYIVFDPITETPVRCVKFTDMSPSNRLPWAAWHTHSDLLLFWSKAPADDIRPCAEAMQILFNQALDNRAKRNFGMRAVNPEMFPDLNQFDWRPDGIIIAKPGLGNKALSSGIYEIKTEEVGGTIDLVQFIDNFIGQKSGITADTQGESDEKRVGIYYGNLEQVADRLGLYNKSYVEAHADLGVLFQQGVRMHMTEGYMVRWIGEDGAVADGEVTREDATITGEGDRIDFEVDVVGGMAEMRANAIKKEGRKNALKDILANPNLAPKLNGTWAIKEILAAADYERDEIQLALDVNSDGSLDQLARASQAIQDILEGITPKIMRTADTSFIQKINDYAIDEVEDPKTFDRLMAYIDVHRDIVLRNMERKARLNPLPPMGAGGMPGGRLAPSTAGIPANTPGGTTARSSAPADMGPGSPASLPPSA